MILADSCGSWTGFKVTDIRQKRENMSGLNGPTVQNCWRGSASGCRQEERVWRNRVGGVARPVPAERSLNWKGWLHLQVGMFGSMLL